MKKEDKEKEEIRLSLEKIKISHANELSYINRKMWLKVTIIFGGLFLGVTAILRIIPKNQVILIVLLVLAYFIILFEVTNYAWKSDFYGKPTGWYDKIYYYIFLDFIKKREGIIKKYEKEIDKLINQIKR